MTTKIYLIRVLQWIQDRSRIFSKNLILYPHRIHVIVNLFHEIDSQVRIGMNEIESLTGWNMVLSVTLLELYCRHGCE